MYKVINRLPLVVLLDKLIANISQRTDLPRFKKYDIVFFNSERVEDDPIFWMVDKNIKKSMVKLLPFKTITNYQYTVDRARDPVYTPQYKLSLANTTFETNSQGFDIGLAEYRRITRILSDDNSSRDSNEHNEERQFEAVVSPTKLFNAQLVAKHFIGTYIYWLTAFGYFHPDYMRNHAKPGNKSRSVLTAFVLQRIIPIFGGKLQDVPDPEKTNLLCIYSSTIDASCYRVLKFDISSGPQFRKLIGIGKTKAVEVFQEITSFRGCSLCEWWNSEQKYCVPVCAPDLSL